MTRGWKFQIYKVEELYYPCSENKGADQLRSYCEAELRLCFRIGKYPVFSRCGNVIVFISGNCGSKHIALLWKHDNCAQAISAIYDIFITIIILIYKCEINVMILKMNSKIKKLFSILDVEHQSPLLYA